MPDYVQSRGGVLVPESAQRAMAARDDRWKDRARSIARRYPNLPGGGEPIIEAFEMYVARYQSTTQDYLNPDVAYQMDRQLQRAMIQDPVVMEPLEGRMLPVSLLDWVIKPEDENDAEQKAAAKIVESIIRNIPSFLKLKKALMWGLWYGRYGVELRFAWDRDPGKTYGDRLKEIKEGKPDKLLTVAGWTPVHGDKIKMHQATGDFGVYVNTGEFQRNPNLGRGHEANVYWIRGTVRDRWIVHRHEILDGDFFEPEKAGSISGVGLRERVWWPWWFKQQALGWMMNWMERLGMGFTIWYFDEDNAESEAKVREAATRYRGDTQITFPRGRDGSRGSGIDRIEASTAGGQFVIQVIDDYFGGQIKIMIAGQTLTSETGPTGLGSNVAEKHADTKELFLRFDAANLDETLTTYLVSVIQRWCFPKLRGKLRYESVIQKQDPEAVMNAADKLFNWGAELPEDHLRETVGIPKPKPGEKTLKKQDGMMPGMGGPAAPMGGEAPQPAVGDSAAEPTAGPQPDEAAGNGEPVTDPDEVLQALNIDLGELTGAAT